MNRAALMSKPWVSLLKEVAQEWNDRKAMRLAAALAYYSVFSIAPLLLICLSVAGWVFGPEAARGHLDEELRDIMSPRVAESVQSFIADASTPAGSFVAAISGLLTLLLGAAGVFAQLKDALNTIWETQSARHSGILYWFRGRLLSFGMVLLIGLLLLASVVASTTLSSLTKDLPINAPVSEAVIHTLGSLLSVAITTLLFAAIFKWLPETPVRWRHVWLGAGVTSVLFEGGKFGLAFYLGRESTSSTYGAAASVVLVLLWVYYASLILFLGAIFTKVWAQRHLEPMAPLAVTHSVERDLPALEPLDPLPSPARVARPWSLLITGAAAGMLLGLVLRKTPHP